MDPIHQFQIVLLLDLIIGTVDISFSTSALAMLVTVIVIYGLLSIGMRKAGMVPSPLQSIVELLYGFVAKMVRDNAGPEAHPFIPFVFTLFTFILFGNLLGMVPGFFTFTSHIIVTFALGLTVIILVTTIGIIKHGFHFFSLFFPHGAPVIMAPILVPIEIISYLVRPFSLAIRLFVNMMAGHTMLKVFAGFAVMAITALGEIAGLFAALGPVAITVALTGFEIAIAVLQAYVFTILTCLYIRDALYLH